MELLIITADTNDADYITQQIYIKDEKELAEIKRILSIIKTKTNQLVKKGPNRHNWPTSDYSQDTVGALYKGKLNEGEIEWFNQYVPYGEFGIHTIVSAIMYHVEKEEKLFEFVR
jgi:hypothetical protein